MTRRGWFDVSFPSTVDKIAAAKWKPAKCLRHPGGQGEGGRMARGTRGKEGYASEGAEEAEGMKRKKALENWKMRK